MEIIVPHIWDLREAFLVEVEPLPQTPRKCVRPPALEQDVPVDLLHRAMKDFDDMEAKDEHFAARSLAALQCVRSLTQVYHGDPRYTHYHER